MYSPSNENTENEQLYSKPTRNIEEDGNGQKKAHEKPQTLEKNMLFYSIFQPWTSTLRM